MFGLNININDLNQLLGLSTFYPKMGWNNPGFLECIFR